MPWTQSYCRRLFSHAAIAEVEKEEHVRWINNDWNAPAASTSSKILSFKRQEEEEEEEDKTEKVNRRQKQQHQKCFQALTDIGEEELARNPICSENSFHTIPKDALYGIATQRAIGK